jgi:DNA repair protein RadC
MRSVKQNGLIVQGRGQLTKLSSPEETGNYFMSLWDKETIRTRESMYVVYLAYGHKPIEYKLLATGNEHSVSFNIDTILRRAIELNAKNIAVAHNHPSGNLTPSEADLECTEEIYIKCMCLGLTFNDHLIVTPNGDCTSLANMGYFEKFESNYKYLVNARKAGSYENVALTLLNRSFEQIGKKINPAYVYKQLTDNLEKVYVKYFDPII